MKTFKRTIEGNIGCEVDVTKWDCNREQPHCHITYNGKSFGQVWTSSITFERGIPDELSSRQANTVLDFVRDNRYEIEDVYNHNRTNGADG